MRHLATHWPRTTNAGVGRRVAAALALAVTGLPSWGQAQDGAVALHNPSMSWRPRCEANSRAVDCTAHLAREWFKVAGLAPAEEMAGRDARHVRIQVSRDRHYRPLVLALERDGRTGAWALIVWSDEHRHVLETTAAPVSVLALVERLEAEAAKPTLDHTPRPAKSDEICLHSDFALVESLHGGRIERRAQDACPEPASVLFAAISDFVRLAQDAAVGCAPTADLPPRQGGYEYGFRIDLQTCLRLGGDRRSALGVKLVHDRRWNEVGDRTPGIWIDHVSRIHAQGDSGVVTGEWSVQNASDFVELRRGPFMEIWRRGADATWRAEQAFGLPPEFATP